MIVVDTNVIAYLFIQGDYSKNAVFLLKYDPIWIVPFLWKSEFRNVITLYIRKGNLSLEDAQNIMNEAEEFLSGNEYDVNSFEVFELVSKSNCSAYDCEFVALAKRLDLVFYTSDKKILREFKETAVDLKSFKD